MWRFRPPPGLLRRLGLDVSERKLVAPSTKVTCLGVEIDTVKHTVAIPQNKMQRIVAMVQEWKSKKYCSKTQLQSLLGHLLYIDKCVKPSRFFLNRMLENNYDKVSITLTSDFRRDLRWFDAFVRDYNGVSYFEHNYVRGVVELDACLEGMGDRFQSNIPNCG